MLHLYSQITGAFQLSVNTLQVLRKDRDIKIQNYLSNKGMGLRLAELHLSPHQWCFCWKQSMKDENTETAVFTQPFFHLQETMSYTELGQ